jgi:hypothetical protein
VFYAGGGGGSVYQAASTSAVGLGVAGGGNGGAYNADLAPTPATANTGGGGGGNERGTNQTGSNGGSGIVIIRYPATQSAPTATTGSPQINYADGYQIYTWTSSGTVTF